uniref:Uncharacterized protein n=1 Tax=Ascaris lumbricoides TaxID=6252 RepID=A0A9J2PGL8_ASCLU
LLLEEINRHCLHSEWRRLLHFQCYRLLCVRLRDTQTTEINLATKDVRLGSAGQMGKQSSETGSTAKTSNGRSKPQSQPKENRIPACDNGPFPSTEKSKGIPPDRTKRQKLLKDENNGMKKELKPHRPLRSVISTVLAALPSKCKGKKEASIIVHKMRTRSTLRKRDCARTPTKGNEKTGASDTAHRRHVPSQDAIKETQQPYQECNAKDILPTPTKPMNIKAPPQMKQIRASNEDMSEKTNSKSPKPSPLTLQPQASPAKSRKSDRPDGGKSENIKRQTVATQASEESSRRLPAQRSNTQEPQATSSPGRNPRTRFAQRKIYCVRDRNDPDYKTLRELWSEFSDVSSEQNILSSQVEKDVGSRELRPQAAVVDGSRSRNSRGNDEREITGTNEDPHEFTATSHALSELTAPGDGRLLEAMQSSDAKQWRELENKGISTSISGATQH